MHKWMIRIALTPELSGVLELVYDFVRCLFSGAGFTVSNYDREFGAGLVSVTAIRFTVTHVRPSALTAFLLQYSGIELTVTEL